MSDGIPGASAVSFHFGDAHHGWIAMQVTADGAARPASDDAASWAMSMRAWAPGHEMAPTPR